MHKKNSVVARICKARDCSAEAQATLGRAVFMDSDPGAMTDALRDAHDLLIKAVTATSAALEAQGASDA